MNPATRFERCVRWVVRLPIALAFRIVWAMALTGNRNAREVYAAMWDANLSLPRLKGFPNDQ